MNASAATSIARFVDANMNARAAIKCAPFIQMLRVADSAANEHDEEANPSNIARPTFFGFASPRYLAASPRERNTWIDAETA